MTANQWAWLFQQFGMPTSPTPSPSPVPTIGPVDIPPPTEEEPSTVGMWHGEAPTPTPQPSATPSFTPAQTPGGISPGATPNLGIGGNLPGQGWHYYPDAQGGYTMYDDNWNPVGSMPGASASGTDVPSPDPGAQATPTPAPTPPPPGLNLPPGFTPDFSTDQPASQSPTLASSPPAAGTSPDQTPGGYVPGQGYLQPGGNVVLPPGTTMPGGAPIYNQMSGQWIDPVTGQVVPAPAQGGSFFGNVGNVFNSIGNFLGGLVNQNVPTSPFLGGMAGPANWQLQTGGSGSPGGNVGAPGEGNLYYDARNPSAGTAPPPSWYLNYLNLPLAQLQAMWAAAGSPGAGSGGVRGGAGPRAL